MNDIAQPLTVADAEPLATPGTGHDLTHGRRAGRAAGREQS